MHGIHPTNPTRNVASRCASLTLTLVCTLSAAAAQVANPVPTKLPDPDGLPGDPGKPVQVYILAGQSNMVGMGDIRGARNPYQGVFLTADPAVPQGPFEIYKVGRFQIAPLPVFAAGDQATTQPVARGEIAVPPGRYRLRTAGPSVPSWASATWSARSTTSRCC